MCRQSSFKGIASMVSVDSSMMTCVQIVSGGRWSPSYEYKTGSL